MKLSKLFPIVLTLVTACGTGGSFEGGSQSPTQSASAGKKSRSQGKNAVASESSQDGQKETVRSTDDGFQTAEQDSGKSATERQEKANPEEAPSAPTPQGLALADQMESSVKASMASALAARPNALSVEESARLTAALSAVGKNAALGAGAQANAAALKAVLDLVGNLANINLPALPGLPLAGVNVAALADVAQAVQDLAAAAAAADLAGVQAAIADIIQAIMDLIA